MTIYSKGEIVLGEFPFSSGTASKVRPFLILVDTGDADVLVARMTGNRAIVPFDISILDWRGANLYSPATIRLHKLNTIEKQKILRRIGALQSTDYQRVAAILQQMFGAW